MRTLVGIGLVAAAALAALALASAQGASDAAGSLATGGTAKGDISPTPGEFDTIGVNLEQGSRVNVKWNSGFAATVAFLAPSGQPITIGFDSTRSASLRAWTVPETGRYEFRVASATTGQGNYSLQVLPYWDKTVVLDGSDRATFDVPMPAAGSIRGKVQPLPGASNPSILSLRSPSGSELLVNPIVGTVGVAKLKTVACNAAGVYQFTAQAASGTKEFRARLKRASPRIPLKTLDLTNGLAAVSYATGGVASYFGQHCASCHSTLGSYDGVRAYAGISLARIQSGNMPLGGPRANAATISLIQQWITTGYRK